MKKRVEYNKIAVGLKDCFMSCIPTVLERGLLKMCSRKMQCQLQKSIKETVLYLHAWCLKRTFAKHSKAQFNFPGFLDQKISFAPM